MGGRPPFGLCGLGGPMLTAPARPLQEGTREALGQEGPRQGNSTLGDARFQKPQAGWCGVRGEHSGPRAPAGVMGSPCWAWGDESRGPVCVFQRPFSLLSGKQPGGMWPGHQWRKGGKIGNCYPGAPRVGGRRLGPRQERCRRGMWSGPNGLRR